MGGCTVGPPGSLTNRVGGKLSLWEGSSYIYRR